MVNKKTKAEIEVLRAGGRVLYDIMDKLCAAAGVGVMTGDLEKLACQLIAEAGGRPAQKDFPMPDGRVFPTAIITCINHEVVHAAALPSRELKEGDILSIDYVMEYPYRPIASELPKEWPVNNFSHGGGFYTDMSRTIPIGKISADKQKLIDVTRRSLELAIAAVKPGNSLRDIGLAVQPYVEANGFSVIRDLVGHGVGYSLHESPHIPNYIISEGSANVVFEPGMVLAIEPMVAMGNYRVKENHRNFAYYTADRKPSAHFEHTVVVTEEGCEVLTRP